MKGMTNASPGVGQFAAGKLGTIKGGTADGSVQAQEDGTGTVVGWSGKADTADVAKKADKTALDATDAKVTQIQTAVGDCFNAAEITSDGKLQLTAVDGQVNALTLPNGGEWTKISSLGSIDTSKLKIGSMIIASTLQEIGDTNPVNMCFIYSGKKNSTHFFVGSGYMYVEVQRVTTQVVSAYLNSSKFFVQLYSDGFDSIALNFSQTYVSLYIKY